MKHKHAEFIHAWADGKMIQMSIDGRKWIDITSPAWAWDTHEQVEYRIKPEPKPDIVRNVVVEATSPLWIKVYESGKFLPPNLRLHFDGETGKLKSAEVI